MHQQEYKAKNTKKIASQLFPNEQWIYIDENIFIAASRAPRSSRESEILAQEISQARILATLGHTIYLLPEFGSSNTKHPDAIVDGLMLKN